MANAVYVAYRMVTMHHLFILAVPLPFRYIRIVYIQQMTKKHNKKNKNNRKSDNFPDTVQTYNLIMTQKVAIIYQTETPPAKKALLSR